MLFTIYFQFETQLINTRIKDLLCRCDFIDLTDMWNYFAILQHKNRFILSFFFWKRIALKAHISLENIVLSFMTKVSHKNVLKKQRKTNVTLRMSSCSTSSVWFKFLKVFVLECLINKQQVKFFIYPSFCQLRARRALSIFKSTSRNESCQSSTKVNLPSHTKKTTICRIGAPWLT